MKRSCLSVLCAVALGSLVAGAQAAGLPRTDNVDAVDADIHPGAAWHSSLQREQSACRRYSVTWSGGVALRGPDRISPRPVRSRWQDAGARRVRCQEGDGFSQRRVAATPWVR